MTAQKNQKKFKKAKEQRQQLLYKLNKRTFAHSFQFRFYTLMSVCVRALPVGHL